VVAIFALLLPIFLEYWQEWKPAGVTMEAPEIVRISEYELKSNNDAKKTTSYRTNVILQPAFTGQGVNQKVETLTKMRLAIYPPGSGQEPTKLYARSFGELAEITTGVEQQGQSTSEETTSVENASDGPVVTAARNATYSYKYVADAGVLTVPPNGAQTPLVKFGTSVTQPPFKTPVFGESGRYRLSVTVERNSRYTGPKLGSGSPSPPFEACLTLSPLTLNRAQRMHENQALIPLMITDHEDVACR
jgi:hypothetical protein